MREVDFYQLPRHVQERFVVSSRGAGLPSWLLSCRPSKPYPWLWTGIGLAGLTVAVVTCVVGFGALGNPLAITGATSIAFYAFGLVTALLGLLYASAKASEHEWLDYPAAIYLYPAGVIDAMTARPRVYPLSSLADITLRGRMLVLRFSGSESFEFDAQTPQRAAEVEQQVHRCQTELAQAEHDPRELAALDPLTDSGVPNPLLSTTRLVQKRPWWVRWAVPLAVVVGTALGVGVWSLRNSLSDRRMYGKAVKTGTVEAFRAYLSARGRDPSVSELWLPRAELKRARSEGTVEAIERFADQHPGSKIAGEVSQAMHDALLAELAKAKESHRVSALRAITRHRQYRMIAPEHAAAIHEMYVAAWEQFRKDSPDGAKELHAFMRRLLDYAEQHGPTVQLRFRRQPSSSVEIMADQIKRSPYATEEHLPVQYFDAAHDAAREDKVAALLLPRLQREFPDDILHFERGPEIGAGAAAFEVPTLAIKYTTYVTGAATLNKPRGVFVALSIAFDTSWSIPGDNKPFTLQFRRSAPPDIRAVLDEELSPEALYQRMTDKCYTDFARAYLGSLFKQP